MTLQKSLLTGIRKQEKLMESILQSNNPKQIVHALAPQEMLMMMSDQTPSNSLVLLELASTEQLVKITDMTCWEENSFSVSKFMEFMQHISEASKDQLANYIKHIDSEYVAIVLLKSCRVLHKKEYNENENLVDDEHESIMYSPDMNFVLVFQQKDPIQFILKPLLDYLYASDFERAYHILQACRFELLSSLESEMLRFRTGRMEEIGIPSFDEAEGIIKFITDQQMKKLLKRKKFPDIAMQEGFSNTSLLVHVRDFDENEYFAQVMRLVDEDVRPKLFQSFVYIFNKIAVLQGLNLGESDTYRTASTILTRNLVMALQKLVGNNINEAANILSRVHPQYLFRYGYTKAALLKEKTARFMRQLGGSDAVQLFDRQDKELLETLLQLDVLFLGVKTEMSDTFYPSNYDELIKANARLDILMQRASLFRDMIFSDSINLVFDEDLLLSTRPPFSTLFLTSLLNKIIYDKWRFKAILLNDFLNFLKNNFEPALDGEPSHLKPELREILFTDFSVLIQKLYPKHNKEEQESLITFLNEIIDDFEQAYGFINPDDPKLDIRFIEKTVLIK